MLLRNIFIGGKNALGRRCRGKRNALFINFSASLNDSLIHQMEVPSKPEHKASCRSYCRRRPKAGLTNLWQAENFPWHTVFTAVTGFLIYFVRPTSLYFEEYFQRFLPANALFIKT
jgi:hypothetical protein